MQRTQLIDLILNKVLNHTKQNQITIVGIDGVGCSGKTQLATELYQALKSTINCELVSLDDFCKPKVQRYNADKDKGLQVYYYNFEEEQFEEHILKTTHYGHTLDYYFTALHAPSDTYSIPKSYYLKSGVLLIEGIHLFKANFQQYFDLKIFLEISPQIQLARALQRDITLGNSIEDIRYKYTQRYQPSYTYYLQHDQPLSCVDLIINNDDPQNPSISSVPSSKYPSFNPNL